MKETQVLIKNNKILLPESLVKKNDNDKFSYMFFCHRSNSELMRRLGLTNIECENIVDASNINCRWLDEASYQKLVQDIKRVCKSRAEFERTNRYIFGQMTSSKNNKFDIPFMYSSYFSAGEFVAITTEKGKEITEVWDKSNIQKIKEYLKVHKKEVVNSDLKSKLIARGTNKRLKPSKNIHPTKVVKSLKNQQSTETKKTVNND